MGHFYGERVYQALIPFSIHRTCASVTWLAARPANTTLGIFRPSSAGAIVISALLTKLIEDGNGLQWDAVLAEGGRASCAGNRALFAVASLPVVFPRFFEEARSP